MLARAITAVENPHVRDALDIAAAAVLIAAAASVAVGMAMFGARAVELLGW